MQAKLAYDVTGVVKNQSLGSGFLFPYQSTIKENAQHTPQRFGSAP